MGKAEGRPPCAVLSTLRSNAMEDGRYSAADRGLPALPGASGFPGLDAALVSPGLRRRWPSTRNSPSSSRERDAPASGRSIHVSDSENRIMKKLGYLLALVPSFVGYLRHERIRGGLPRLAASTSTSATSTASPKPSRGRSARRTSPAKRARPAWPPKAPARARRASWARAGRSRPRSASRPGRTFTLAEIDGPGCIQQIWMTPTGNWRALDPPLLLGRRDRAVGRVPGGRFLRLRLGQVLPDQLAAGVRQSGQRLQLLLADALPQEGAGSRWRTSTTKDMTLYYQINYTLTDVPKTRLISMPSSAAKPRCQQKGLYTILDGVEGQGQYVGTYLAWEVHSPGWWGEGEIKFFMDGDKEFPTICGTGTEDYFCGSYNFENRRDQRNTRRSPRPTPAWRRCCRPTRPTKPGQRFGLYRWHIADPVRFEKDLKVTIQALGWQERRALSAAGGRHRLGRLLVSERAAQASSRSCPRGCEAYSGPVSAAPSGKALCCSGTASAVTAATAASPSRRRTSAGRTSRPW